MSIGDEVWHHKYGTGILVEIVDTEKARVKFDFPNPYTAQPDTEGRIVKIEDLSLDLLKEIFEEIKHETGQPKS